MVAESGGLWFKADFHGVRHMCARPDPNPLHPSPSHIPHRLQLSSALGVQYACCPLRAQTAGEAVRADAAPLPAVPGARESARVHPTARWRRRVPGARRVQEPPGPQPLRLHAALGTRLDSIHSLTILTNHRWPTVACARARAALQDQVVRAVVQQCPMLLYLNLSRTPIGDTGIWSIAKCATHLFPSITGLNHSMSSFAYE